jgi:hypothetical protein
LEAAVIESTSLVVFAVVFFHSALSIIVLFNAK